jgi:hypothetical protein
MDRDADTGRALCEMLDLARPGLAAVRQCADAGDYPGALAAYGRYLLVNSGADAYSDRGVFSRYFGGTLETDGVKLDGQALLVVTDAAGQVRGLSLDTAGGGQEFELGAGRELRKLADIRVPAGFRWLGDGGRIRPMYE